MTKEERIKKEKRRLIKIYKDLPEKEYKTSLKLIDNIAFMVVTLEDLMAEINNDDLIVLTVNASQSFLKEHPALSAYNKMYTNFQKGIQQLTSLLPKASNDEQSSDDEFVNFLKNKKQ